MADEFEAERRAAIGKQLATLTDDHGSDREPQRNS
jgi:hypothetical protein